MEQSTSINPKLNAFKKKTIKLALLLSLVPVLASGGTGDILWKTNWGLNYRAPIFASPKIGRDGAVYIGSGISPVANYFYALNSDGSVKWRFETWIDNPDGAAAIGIDGTVYFSAGKSLYALNQDGTLKWEIGIGSNIKAFPSIGNDGTIYIGAADYSLYAICPDGEVKWSFHAGMWIGSGPAIGPDNTIYFGSFDKKVYAINPDGSEKWSFETGDFVACSPAVASDGTIYIGSNDANFYAFNPDGTIKWTFAADAPIISSPAIDFHGIVYFGTQHGTLYALYDDGSLRWSTKAGGYIDLSPIIGPDNVIYCGSGTHINSEYHGFQAYNYDGSLKWQIPLEGMVIGTPAMDDRGVIYFSTDDGYVFAVDAGDYGEGNPRWSSFHNDLGNKGYQPVYDPSEILVSFIAEPVRKPAPMTVVFKDRSLGNIINWEWDFGDGSINQERHPAHTYTEKGVYTAKLTVKSPSATKTAETVIIVDPQGVHKVPLHYGTIQEAIDAAVNGDTILVADGTYQGHGNRDIEFRGKAITVKSENGPENTVIDAQSKGRGFNFDNGETTDSVLDGFTIVNGNANSPDQGYSGGGIQCFMYSSPKITNCIISNNFAYSGGGVYFGAGSSPQIVDCRIINNCADTQGGGISVWGNDTSPQIINCTISGNYSYFSGGGIYIYSGAFPKIHNSSISRNWGLISHGGGIYCSQSGMELNDCCISENTGFYGGGIYSGNNTSYDVEIFNCIVSDNLAETGAGIYLEYTNPSIDKCRIMENRTFLYGAVISENPFLGFGGGIYAIRSEPALTNCVISGNISSRFGGGLYFGDIAPLHSNIINCTLSKNEAYEQGSGLYCSTGVSGSLDVKNCIFWDNINSEINTGDIAVTFSNIKGGYEGLGNMNKDPLFSKEDMFSLYADSPCIDSGDRVESVSEDIDGELRPYGGYYDMGADEFMVTLSEAISILQMMSGISPPIPPKQYFNNDNKIGSNEAIFILQAVSGIRQSIQQDR